MYVYVPSMWCTKYSDISYIERNVIRSDGFFHTENEILSKLL